jgi:hypothetical protein
LASIESFDGGIEEFVEFFAICARSLASSASNAAIRSSTAASRSSRAPSSAVNSGRWAAIVAVKAPISASLASTTCRNRALAARSRSSAGVPGGVSDTTDHDHHNARNVKHRRSGVLPASSTHVHSTREWTRPLAEFHEAED